MHITIMNYLHLLLTKIQITLQLNYNIETK